MSTQQTPQQLPQDPREVQLQPGSLFGTPGVYLATEGGHAFIPAHCLPDVRRRLGVISDRLTDTIATHTSPRARKATSK